MRGQDLIESLSAVKAWDFLSTDCVIMQHLATGIKISLFQCGRSRGSAPFIYKQETNLLELKRVISI